MGDGYCECGCGEKTNLAIQDHPKYGWVKGQPLRFIRGHNNIGKHPRLGDPYRVEDCGYETPCWLWNGYRTESGYGRSSTHGKAVQAHRMIYERHKGPIPTSHFLDHLCRNPPCVNPDHLEPVTHQENCRRGSGTKLTVDEVREIRRLLAERHSGSDLAQRFGVSPVTICNIKYRRRWADV